MGLLSRRGFLGWSVAGAAFMPFRAVAAGPPLRGSGATASPGVDKCTWTLIRPDGADRRKFQHFVLRDLAKAAGQLVNGVASISVTLQEPDAYSGASVRIGNGDQSIDAVLEITCSKSYPALDPVNAHLLANCGHVQGWRVKPTLIYDASTPAAIGDPSPLPHVLVFVQRLDGTTPGHFDRNWYIHAGHLDGKEAESEQSRADRERRERSSPGHRYVQNRVLEAVTPTAWVVSGYTQLYMPSLIPGPGPRYERDNGEEIFERWPPRIVQGYEYRVL